MKNIFLVLGAILLLNSCYKSYTHDNKYDLGYNGNRDYTLEFDHIEVVNETSTDNVNGLLDVEEAAELHVYLKNNGPDPCMLTEGTFDAIPSVHGFYIKNTDIGINDGGLQFLGSSEELGYKVQYIDPGATDYIKVDVRVYPYCDPNQDIACEFVLMDDDGQSHTVNFNVHVE